MLVNIRIKAFNANNNFILRSMRFSFLMHYNEGEKFVRVPYITNLVCHQCNIQNRSLGFTKYMEFRRKNN